ncbi:MAG: DUF2442 domain-containing protein [Eubacteriales bacterium]|nr:DUF2442 domain-containing protein [Eubacteriales bacterium]
MRIENGIAYANGKNELNVTSFEIIENYKVRITFDNGEKRTFDFKTLLNKPAFLPLNDMGVFKSVNVEHGIPTWNNGNIDISPEYLYKAGEI